jgi:hypothetical protein
MLKEGVRVIKRKQEYSYFRERKEQKVGDNSA